MVVGSPSHSISGRLSAVPVPDSTRSWLSVLMSTTVPARSLSPKSCAACTRGRLGSGLRTSRGSG